MTSIRLLVETIERKQFRRLYLRTKDFFSIYFFIFRICIKFRTLSKKDALIASVFLKLPTVNDVLR